MHPVENVEELVESVSAQVAKHHILQLLRLITFVVFVVDDGANIVAVKSCLVVMFQTDLLVDFDNAEGY